MKKILILIAILLVSGCTGQGNDVEIELAKQSCISLCEEYSEDKTAGPCLSDVMEWEIDNWVCDIAHDPREPVDDQLANQCAAYHDGKASHFVEVEEDCKVIQVR